MYVCVSERHFRGRCTTLLTNGWFVCMMRLFRSGTWTSSTRARSASNRIVQMHWKCAPWSQRRPLIACCGRRANLDVWCTAPRAMKGTRQAWLFGSDYCPDLHLHDFRTVLDSLRLSVVPSPTRVAYKMGCSVRTARGDLGRVSCPPLPREY